MEFKDIQQVNATLTKTDIKGKEYVMVNERIKAFRQLYPEGTIETEIISLEDGIVTIKATVKNIDIVLGTGHAQEKETSSYINKTSYIENCETSAVGRALGMLGIGIDTSFASYEEVANAQLNQQKAAEKSQVITDRHVAALRAYADAHGLSEEKICAGYNIKDFSELTYQRHNAIVNPNNLNELKQKYGK